MSVLRRNPFLALAARRFLAAGSVALVLLLTTLTASPELHRLFHGHDDVAADDGCAVVQFAHGVSVAPNTALLAATPAVWRVLGRPEISEIDLSSPHYLHQPERGPPAS